MTIHDVEFDSADSRNFDSLRDRRLNCQHVRADGWAFAANDIVCKKCHHRQASGDSPQLPGVYTEVIQMARTRALVTDYSLEKGGELDFRALAQGARCRLRRSVLIWKLGNCFHNWETIKV
jgi:hypothetical protein